MKGLLFAVVLCLALGAIALAVLAKLKGGKSPGETAKPKRPLTEREQAMYFRLRDALPEHVVLSQVAFSAVLTAKGRATRNRFDRKVADFLICSKAFEVVAAIELDDASHKGRARQDTEREQLLTGAGYRVLRYGQVPNVLDVQRDIAACTGGPRS